MDRDGTGQRRLTDPPQDKAFLDRSPDGEKIAFSTDPTAEPAPTAPASPG